MNGNWVTAVLWTIGALVTIGLTWGWARSRILQHDEDIESTNDSLDELKRDNKQEHRDITTGIAGNREMVSTQYAEIKEFMGAVKTFMEK